MRFFVILMSAILLSSSCKKSDLNSELDVAVITNKVKNLKSMQNALNIVSELRDMNIKKINPNLMDDAKVQDYIKKINSSKTKQELVSVFNSAGIQESDELLNKLESINNNILDVYRAVPELEQLTAQVRTQIFTEIYEEYNLINKLKLQSEFLGKLNLSKNMFVEDLSGCYEDFNIGWGACENSFNIELGAIWAGVLFASESSLGIGAFPAVGAGLIATAAVYLQRQTCQSATIASFASCTGNMY